MVKSKGDSFWSCYYFVFLVRLEKHLTADWLLLQWVNVISGLMPFNSAITNVHFGASPPEMRSAIIYKCHIQNQKSIDKTVTRASLQQAAVDVYSEGLSSEIQ